MEYLSAYLLLGACAGILAGMLGVGGGLILVPALLYLFQLQGVAPAIAMPLALGTSLGAIVLTALSSIAAHHRHCAIDWSIFRQLLPGLVIGAALGTSLASLVDSSALRILFGLFELLVALQMASSWRPSPQRTLPGHFGMGVSGTVIGLISSLLGIGGGTLTVPLLVWCNIALRQAVATSAACGLPIAIAGAIGYLAHGWGLSQLPAGSSGYLYWPALIPLATASLLTAPLGAWLTHKLPVSLLKRALSFVLFVIGLKMLGAL